MKNTSIKEIKRVPKQRKAEYEPIRRGKVHAGHSVGDDPKRAEYIESLLQRWRMAANQ